MITTGIAGGCVFYELIGYSQGPDKLLFSALKKKLSLRTRPQPGVAIPELYRSVMGSFPLKTGGFPRQCDHWLGMTPLFRQSDIMEIMLQGIENRIRIEFVESDVPNTKNDMLFQIP